VMDTSLMTSETTHDIIVREATNAPESAAPQPAFTPSLTASMAGDVVYFDASASVTSTNPQFRWDWENDGVFDTDFSSSTSASHMFTIAGDTTVRLEIVDDSGFSGAALENILITPDFSTSLLVLPQDVLILGNWKLNFKAIAWDQFLNPMFNPDVTWSVEKSLAGAIDPDGLFIAGIAPGVYKNAIKATLDELVAYSTVEVWWPYVLFAPVGLR
jgi:hypothetical protein